MDNEQVKSVLQLKLGFTKENLRNLELLHDYLLKTNKEYNLISKSTENSIWTRHILDSAQLVKYIDFADNKSLADLGSGAGFPGLIMAIYNRNPLFHVKLYEKSKIKRNFLIKLVNDMRIKCDIHENVYNSNSISSDYILCRAFKKLQEVIRISREIVKKPHKLIVLKGKNAQEEINNVSKVEKFDYKLIKSITDNDSKILVANFI
tara:strand:+ start:32 stop:649 length:618 start_codon:yes stop_codon:yes gene_type:complete